VVAILPVLGEILTVVSAPNLIALVTYYLKIKPKDASVGGMINTRMPLLRAWIIFGPEEAQQAAIIRQMHEKQQGQCGLDHGRWTRQGRKSGKKLTVPTQS
jgi:hypothetical protein